MKTADKLAKVRRIKKQAGWRGIRQWALGPGARKLRERRQYRKWMKANDISSERRLALAKSSGELAQKPLISIILPVYNVDEKWLRLCIGSVLEQIYTNWELCIADDHSDKPHVCRILDEYTAADDRIKVVFREENGHISAASNSAFELATGEWVVLLDHDDELSEDALFWVANEINTFPDVRMIYSDEDVIDASGRRSYPKFKPDFSPDLFYSLNLVTHISAYRTDLMKKLGGFRIGYEGSQDYDLALRAIEEISEEQIRHIPKILYHWRAIPGSVAFGGEEKPYAHDRARTTIEEHLQRTGQRATVTHAVANHHRVRYYLPDETPLVSVIIDANLGFVGAEGILTAADNSKLEILFIGGSNSHNSDRRVRHLDDPGGSHTERLNLAASNAAGDILCFVDGGLEPTDEVWLEEMVRFAMNDKIGVVGAKILDSDHAVQHGGIVIGAGTPIGFAHRGFMRDEDGNMLRNMLSGNFSAVSGACMAIRKRVFQEMEGFDAQHFPEHLFDIDLCLRLRERGYRIVFTPFAELTDTGEKGRSRFFEPATSSETDNFAKTWNKYIERDPYYNPNLSKKDASFSIKV